MKMIVKGILGVVGAVGIFAMGAIVGSFGLNTIGALNISRMNEVREYIKQHGFIKACIHLDEEVN
jgi:hypothetical protein